MEGQAMDASSSDYSDSDNEIIPEAIRKVAEAASLDMRPDKSKRLYTACYNTFKKWRKDQKINSYCEDVLLAYFVDLSNKYAPSSLWATYSMIKCTIQCFDIIDISSYNKLISYLKKRSKGYAQKKSSVCTKSDISRFLIEAPDEIYLCDKVSLIFGIAGCLRRVEFMNLKVKDLMQHEDSFFISISKTKNYISRSFTISGPFYDICVKYMNLRPTTCTTNKFFLRYTNGQCVNQSIAINAFGSMPKNIATYLNLPNPKSYTGHSFRRTSATLLVDAGGDYTIGFFFKVYW